MGYTHGRRWSSEDIKEEIFKVMQLLNITRMPTRNEIISVMNNNSLTCVIGRGKGYYGWAKELGLAIKDSETTLGKHWEYIVKNILENQGYQVDKMSQNYPFDLLINENVKIDVKVSRLYKGPTGDFYTFNLEKKYASCDIYIALCLNEKDEIEKFLVIPSSKLKITQLSVGKNSKYDVYEKNFKVIDSYDNFYKKLEAAN